MSTLITNAVLDALRTNFEMKFQAAYEGTPTWYDKISTTIPSGSASNTYGWAALQLTLREWLGPRVAQNLSEHEYAIVNKLYEGTVDLKRTDIQDDNLGIFAAQTIPGLAEASRKHPDRILSQLIAANPNGFDGVSFFHAAHPTFDAAGDTYSNTFTQELNGDGFSIVWSAMASYKGENGLPLSVLPNLLVVPPQLKRAALVVMQSTTYALPYTATTTAATVDNPLRGWADVLVVPELASDPHSWYLADVSKSIKPFIYQVRDAAEFTSRQDPSDPKVFDLDKFSYGVRQRDNVGVALPFLIAKSTGAL